MNERNNAETGSEREIISARLFSASREALFNAFADPECLKQWWGPRGFTNTFQRFDLKPGGKWRFVMRGPEGAEYRNESVFIEVVKPEKIVFRHLEPVHSFLMSMFFTEQSGKTLLTWKMLFESAEEYKKVKKVVIDANEENFDRLQAHFAKMF